MLRPSGPESQPDPRALTALSSLSGPAHLTSRGPKVTSSEAVWHLLPAQQEAGARCPDGGISALGLGPREQ